MSKKTCSQVGGMQSNVRLYIRNIFPQYMRAHFCEVRGNSISKSIFLHSMQRHSHKLWGDLSNQKYIPTLDVETFPYIIFWKYIPILNKGTFPLSVGQYSDSIWRNEWMNVPRKSRRVFPKALGSKKACLRRHVVRLVDCIRLAYLLIHCEII